MDTKTLIKNAAIAFMAQGLSLFVSVCMSLLVPKVLGVTEFAYWQLFIFYVTYSGFFHFGLNDGVYLVEGGKRRDELNKRAINSQFAVELVLQFLFAVVVFIYAAFAVVEADRSFVLTSFAIYTVLYNASYYLGYVFQAVNETKLFSFMAMLERACFVAPLIVFVVIGIPSFKPFVIAYLLSRSIALCFCCWHARDILSAGLLKPNEALRISFKSIKVGFGLMLANIADMLILGVGRFLVDNAWGIEVFGKVSFSLSLVNFFITFVSQAAMVLFPALRQGTKEEQKSFYGAIRNAMEVLFPAIYILYYPMVAILVWWLPQYEESMIYFAFLLPVCVFNTKMSLCCTTYFKVLRMEKTLLAVNIVTVLASLAFALLGVYVLGMLEVVLLGAVASIAGRSLWSENKMNARMNMPGSPMRYEELILTVLFIVCALSIGGLWGCVFYTMFYMVYLLLNKSEARAFMNHLSRFMLSSK